MKYVGMDGGGTHISFSVITEENIQTFEEKTGVNLTSISEKQLKSIFEDIKEKVGLVDGIVVSFSGAGTEKRKKYLKDLLLEIFNTDNLIIYNDGESILYSLYNGENLALVIAGTGSLVMGMNEKKEIIRSGGWGHLFDDVGGGFWISTRIIQEAFKYRDNLRNFDSIFDDLKEFYSVNSIEELTSLQGLNNFKTVISSFTEKALNEPTDVVKEIVDEGIKDLALRSKSMLKNLGIKKIYLYGSLFKSFYYLNNFQNAMKSYFLLPININVSVEMAKLAQKYFS